MARALCPRGHGVEIGEASDEVLVTCALCGVTFVPDRPGDVARAVDDRQAAEDRAYTRREGFRATPTVSDLRPTAVTLTAAWMWFCAATWTSLFVRVVPAVAVGPDGGTRSVVVFVVGCPIVVFALLGLGLWARVRAAHAATLLLSGVAIAGGLHQLWKDVFASGEAARSSLSDFVTTAVTLVVLASWQVLLWLPASRRFFRGSSDVQLPRATAAKR